MERADGDDGGSGSAGDGRARARSQTAQGQSRPPAGAARIAAHQSVTRTAQSFNMTQPAVSRALRQLRGALDDQILVSSGRNARLTDRAETLAAPLARTLGELDLLLTPAGPFDPATE